MRIKPILKFHKDCNFAGQFLIHFFPAYIFAVIFGKPKDSLISESTQIGFISVIIGLTELL